MTERTEHKWAQERAIQSRRHVETAFAELEGKIESGKAAIRHATDKARAPIRLARRHPYWNAALFTFSGLILGYKLAPGRLERKPSGDPAPRGAEARDAFAAGECV